MSAAAIRAGKAWVELAIRDKTDSGLANVKRKFLRWGMGLAAVGSAMTAAAGGILAALTGAAKVFADTGSEIFDLSKATGASAEELSALGYAAEQSGASLADVAATFKGLGKFAGDVTKGTKAADAALQQLGITSAQFLAASPYQRLLLVADALAKISDPGVRSALAMQVLGRSAMKLGSLLSGGAAGVRELVAEAHRLGLVVTQAEADKADALGDAWGAVGKQFRMIAFVGGAALADSLTELAKVIQPVLAGVIAFVRNNPGFVKGFAIAAVAVGAIGGALILFGGTLIFVGAMIGSIGAILVAIPTILATVAAAFGFLLTPVGLLVAALVAIGVAVGGMVVHWLWFDKNVHAVLGGIWNAIATGNWKLAGEIMMAALNVAWQNGLLQTRKLWEDFKLWLISLFADMWAGIFEQTAAAQKKLVEQINAVRGQVGLGSISGFAAIDQAATAARGDADALKRGAAQVRDQNLKPYEDRLARAGVALGDLIRKATAARAKAGPQTPAGLAAGGELAAASPTSSGVAGTFNAAIAGLLGNSGQSAQERTAKATERTADATEGIERELEHFGEDTE